MYLITQLALMLSLTQLLALELSTPATVASSSLYSVLAYSSAASARWQPQQSAKTHTLTHSSHTCNHTLARTAKENN